MIKHDIFPIQSAKTGKKAKTSQSKEEAFQKRTAAKPVLLAWSTGAFSDEPAGAVLKRPVKWLWRLSSLIIDWSIYFWHQLYPKECDLTGSWKSTIK